MARQSLEVARHRAGGAGCVGASLPWEHRFLGGVAGAFIGAATVARARDALAAGGPLDAETARTVAGVLGLWEHSEPVARYPAWVVGAGVVALIAGACPLAVCLIRRGGRAARVWASLLVPLALTRAVWGTWT